LTIDGTQVTVTARLADRYNNPAPDGTAVAFTTNGGIIGGSCTTPLANPGDGTCKVTWVSGGTRPTTKSTPPGVNGKAIILATAIGEESFQDTNGNGYYDAGEPFDDIGEPYRDDNQNNAYDVGEYFLDFNQDGVRNGPSGSFVGITCTGNPPTSCKTNTLAIGSSNIIIMSGSTPDGIQPAGGTPLAAVAHGATSTYTFVVQDVNNNPMPAGTTVAAAVVGTGLTVNAPTSYTVPSTTSPTPYTFSVSAQSTTSPGTYSLNLTITSPGGVSTFLSYPLPVT
jgi:hypothetical protein